jgi:hypothetical protein
MDLVAERDLESLERAVQGLAECRVPHLKAQRLRGVPVGEDEVPSQPRRGDAASQTLEIVSAVSVGGLQLAARSL